MLALLSCTLVPLGECLFGALVDAVEVHVGLA